MSNFRPGQMGPTPGMHPMQQQQQHPGGPEPPGMMHMQGQQQQGGWVHTQFEYTFLESTVYLVE